MRPQAPVPQFDNVPAELRVLAQWVLWIYELVKGRWTKVPYRADGRGKASPTDPRTWSTFRQAMDGYARLEVDGIGFVVSVEDDIAGVDLDHILEADGSVKPWALEIVSLLDTYCEWSPSGQGLRLFALGTLPDGRRKLDDVEMYTAGRFLTTTGRVYGEQKPVNERTVQLAQVHSKYLATPAKPQSPRKVCSPSLTGSLGGGCEGRRMHDHEVIREMLSSSSGTRLRVLWHGDWEGIYSSQSEADLSLVEALLWWTQGDMSQADRLFRQRGLYRDKWDRADYQERTLSIAIG